MGEVRGGKMGIVMGLTGKGKRKEWVLVVVICEGSADNQLALDSNLMRIDIYA
jgi:hypothetical protein